MGQATSSPAEPSVRDTSIFLWSPEFLDCESIGFEDGDYDFTGDLPDDCLAHIFHFLGAGDRKRCSLVCKRWLYVDGQNRHGLSLDAKAEILPFLTCMFNRFHSVTKLALRCDRRSFSLSDEGLVMISIRCSNLTRVKLRGCREITDLGMESFARNCKNLRKLSCGSCNFGDQRVLETVVEELQPVAVGNGGVEVAGGGRLGLAMLKTKLGLLAGRNFVACMFRRWSQSEATSSI